MAADTLFVNGHDVRALTGAGVVGVIDGLQGGGDPRGEHQVIPGRPGAVGYPLVPAHFIITVPLRVYGATRAERNQNFRSLSVLRGTGADCRVSLARLLDGFTDPETAPGAYISGLSLKYVNAFEGRINLQYYQLASYWLDADGVTRYYV